MSLLPSLSPPSHYIKPYPQPELNGELGLTCADLAKVLGIGKKHLIQKLRRMDFSYLKTLGFKIIAVNAAKLRKVGRPLVDYVLNTKAVKAFLARWDNDNGWNYLSWLLDCEMALLKAVPMIGEYRERIACLEGEMAELRSKITAPTPRSVSLEGMAKAMTITPPKDEVITVRDFLKKVGSDIPPTTENLKRMGRDIGKQCRLRCRALVKGTGGTAYAAGLVQDMFENQRFYNLEW